MGVAVGPMAFDVSAAWALTCGAPPIWSLVGFRPFLSRVPAVSGTGLRITDALLPGGSLSSAWLSYLP